LPILCRVDEDEDHVAQIIRVRVERRYVVLITDRVRVAPLKSEIEN